MSGPRWSGLCNHCHRERELESRSTHGERALCDECAAQPYKMPSAVGLDADKVRRSSASCDPLKKATKSLGLKDDPIERAWRPTPSRDAPIIATTKSGMTLRWETQRDLFKPVSLVEPIILAGVKPPTLPNVQKAMEIASWLVQGADIGAREDATEEAQGWLESIALRGLPNALKANRNDRGSWFLGALEFETQSSGWGEPLPLLLDIAKSIDPKTGEVIDGAKVDLHARRRDVAQFVRRDCHTTIGTSKLTARLVEAGAEASIVQAWDPDVPRGRGARHPFQRTYCWMVER